MYSVSHCALQPLMEFRTETQRQKHASLLCTQFMYTHASVTTDFVKKFTDLCHLYLYKWLSLTNLRNAYSLSCLHSVICCLPLCSHKGCIVYTHTVHKSCTQLQCTQCTKNTLDLNSFTQVQCTQHKIDLWWKQFHTRLSITMVAMYLWSQQVHAAHRVHGVKLRSERLHTVYQVDHTVLPEWSCSDPLLLPPAANCGSESPSQRCSRRPSPPFQDVALRCSQRIPSSPLISTSTTFPKSLNHKTFTPLQPQRHAQRGQMLRIRSLSFVIGNVGHPSIGVTKTPTGTDLFNIAHQSLRC